MILSENHRRAIAAAIPADAKMKAKRKFWRKLKSAISVYTALSAGRTRRRPTVQAQKKYRQIIKLVNDLERKLEANGRWPAVEFTNVNHFIAIQPLAVLREIKRRAESGCIAHETFAAAFKGRRDLHREHLYTDMVNLWVKHLKQSPGYSRSREGPTGPLIRFFKACLDPVLRAIQWWLRS